jgi:hypothetical protein
LGMGRGMRGKRGRERKQVWSLGARESRLRGDGDVREVAAMGGLVLDLATAETKGEPMRRVRTTYDIRW